MPTTGGPEDGRHTVLFVPGLWMHSSSWTAWCEEFHHSGYTCSRFRWPGEPITAATGRDGPPDTGARAATSLLGSLTRQCRALGGRPIVIGHGVGGWLAEALLASGEARAAISLARAPTGRAALRLTALPLRLGAGRAWSLAMSRGALLTPAEFHRTFANTVGADESARLYRDFVLPADVRPVLRSSLAARWNGSPCRQPGSARRGPLLLINGAQDRLVHESTAGRLHRRYRRADPDLVTDQVVLPDRGHSLTIDGQWRGVGFYCLDWLAAHDL